jgi:hypothetical protein
MMIEWLHIDGKWEAWHLGLMDLDAYPCHWDWLLV